MKRIYLILIVLTIQFTQAQTQDLQRAKRLFERTYYSEAIPLYEKILNGNRSFEVVKNLADSYYYTNDYANAQRHYRFLISRFPEAATAEYYFRYSQTLKASGNYEESNKVMRDYFLSTNNQKAIEKLEKENLVLENISALGNRFEIKNMVINTPNSEFGATQYTDKLVFSAVLIKPYFLDKVYKWNNESYLDLMSVPLKSARVDSIKKFSIELNTPLHESNAVFTKNGKTAYFTRNNSIDGIRAKNKEKVSVLKIFKAELIDGKWRNVTALPFNSDDYSVEHPALSNDEKTLYFASDMPGSLGSFDIYSVAILGSDYGTPKNLGPTINTDKKEQFPFVSKDNKLYFSSNGHAGYGFLDVFVSEIKNNEFTTPLNVGLPVNSGYDDFSFVIDSDKQHGYFASNRKGGKGRDDIYEIGEIQPLVVENCMQYIAGVITDVDSKLPLAQAKVILQDANKKEIQKVITSADGRFSFSVDCEKSYTVNASKEEYTKASKFLKLYKDRKKTNDASMALKSMQVIKKEELAVEQQKKKEAQLLVEKQKKEAALIAEKAKVEKETAAKKAIMEAEIKKKEKIAAIVTTEKDIVKDKERLLIKTDPIYFDYDLWYIRKESKPILNRVIELMKKYPDMVVEIGSHTDNRGNAKYNLDLSSKRATSTREYFISQGIPEKRIFAKGYGETVQIIKCEPSESCTEEQHELNRRSEFVIKNL
ncbi:flagellar motor protein MotB [Flavobacterium sufflavum]|uniref:Flagellar motor protein MotB n=1 Tax=Flavobacterium sufflavum TaxID=1921138 RepID=A0A437KT07_9FLAO|nr:OmpA family protein [Flavobacterium sufflavum]RVT75272.1 flagellar motor protein MotB [Flavobacterium sufflavum]